MRFSEVCLLVREGEERGAHLLCMRMREGVMQSVEVRV